MNEWQTSEGPVTSAVGAQGISKTILKQPGRAHETEALPLHLWEGELGTVPM